MNLKEAIFIFTKDRPDVLTKTLSYINNLAIRKYIIDDSFQEINQAANKKLTSIHSNIFYCGQNEYDEFIRLYNIDTDKFKSILRKVGTSEWNLGYARNFALLFSKAIDVYKALFVDDDIAILDISLIFNTFSLLENYNFVGANIDGMTDDSIIGFISQDLGIINDNERTLSGGFLAFKPQKIRMPFINVYNEDWIWLLLHSNEDKHLQKNSVFQNMSNPYFDFKDKIIFQEIGEIIFTGISMLNEKKEFRFLISDVFWEKVLNKRKIYLTKLYNNAAIKKKRDLMEMIKWVQDYYKEIDNHIFSELFDNYNNDKLTFREIYNSLQFESLLKKAEK